MSKQTINVGSSANDGTGDPNRTAFQKCNANFTELYDAIPTAQQYKFLLSQSGGDDPQTATSGTLTQGVTYEIVAFETGDDFTLNGAPNNDVGTKWIANGVAPTWSNGSEIGWNNGAPVLVGEITPNTLGMITWSRNESGSYRGDIVGIYEEPFKLFSIVSQNGSAYMHRGWIQYDGDPNYFILETYDFYNNRIDNALYHTSIWIVKNN